MTGEVPVDPRNTAALTIGEFGPVDIRGGSTLDVGNPSGPGIGGRALATTHARSHFGSGQIAEPPEQVGRLIGVARPAFFQQTLQLEFQEFDRPRIEQLPKLFSTQELSQELFIQRQRLRSSLGQRRIALVHVLADVIEHQGGGERRGALRVDHSRADLPRPNRTHQLTQAIHVKDVAQAFAVGFDQDRELGVLAGHLQQVMAALALLPERSALTRPTPR